MRSRQSTYPWTLGLSLVALVLWVVALGNAPLRDWDEATFAQVAREMSASGQWMNPTLHGRAYLNKPPLLFWLISVCFGLAGVSEWTARLPGALITALGVPLLYLAGRHIFGRELPAVLSALVYLTLLPVVRHGRLAMIDGMVNTFLIAALFCLIRGRSSPRWLAGVGIALGLVALAKGLLAVALGGLLLAFLLADGQRALLKSLWLWLGLLAGAVPAVAWYAVQVSEHGSLFLSAHFVSQGTERLMKPVEGHRGPPWFYVGELVKYTFPWLLFAIAGVADTVRPWPDRWARLILVSGGGFLLLISVMATKLPWYVMPLHVFLALAAGYYIARLWAHETRYPQVLVWLLLLGSTVGAAGLSYLSLASRHDVPVGAALIAILTLAAAAALIAAHRRAFVPVLVGGLYSALLLFVLSPSWNWEVNEEFDVRPVAQLIAERVPPSTPVYTTLARGRPSLDYYAGRQVIPISPDARPGSHAGSAYVLVDEARPLEGDWPSSQIVARAGRFSLVVLK